MLLEAVDAAGDGRIDLLGYHTGATFAVEMAARRPDLVRRLVLIGVPFYPDAAAREERRRTLAAPTILTEDLAQFDERWNFLVRGRPPGVSLAAGFSHFVDELRAYPKAFWAHEAAFTHDLAPALRRVAQPTLILNPDNHLAEPSRLAAKLMRNAQVQPLPGPSHQVLELSPRPIAQAIEAFLSQP